VDIQPPDAIHDLVDKELPTLRAAAAAAAVVGGGGRRGREAREAEGAEGAGGGDEEVLFVGLVWGVCVRDGWVVCLFFYFYFFKGCLDLLS
jgi:hypothetical protein